MKATPEIMTRVNGFVAKVQGETLLHYAKEFSILTPPVISMKEGSKNFKLISTHCGSRSVYCFVDKATGNILKAAGWSAPAKHSRGNIFDANYGWGKAVNIYGAVYLR